MLGALDLREPWSSDGELAEGRYEGQLLDSNLRAECVRPGPQGIHVHQAAPHPQNLGELALRHFKELPPVKNPVRSVF